LLDLSNLTQPYFIAEIGINHNGDLQIAKRLIDAAFATSWDCVKFQKRNPDVSVPEHQKNKPKDTPWGRMTYLEYKKRLEFGKEEYDYIDRYCSEKPIDWTASVWDLDSLEFILDYDVPFIKIPSAHLSNEELVMEACRSGLPIVLSTGMHTLEEVDAAVELLTKHARQFALMHTVSTYPAPAEELNLKLIPFYAQRYGCVVGYSGHEYGLNPTILAAGLGAKIIERHITLSHKMWGTDQAASVEVMGMDMLRKRIFDSLKALGRAEKIITDEERLVRNKLRGR